MLGITFLVLALALTPGLFTVTEEATSTAELNCSSPSISDQDKAVCTSLDIMPFLYFGAIMGLASMLIAGGIL